MTFEKHEIYMKRCLELALKGKGKVAPNPMVGAVIVYENRIIGEGYHQQYGGNHAERNAIFSVAKADEKYLPFSRIYVNLEPCSHYGKTPPCADFVIEKKIPLVIVGQLDPFALVAGNGLKKLKKANTELITGILEEESKWLNRRFNTFHEKKRPYIILKWAETADGFMASKQATQKWISNALAKKITHKWRTEEQAILVGRKTAEIDNPQLTARLWKGKQPLRLVIDRNLNLPKNLHLFDGQHKTVVFTAKKSKNKNNLCFQTLDFEKNILPQIIAYLYANNIQSLIVEGGKQVLDSFIASKLWDEARIFVGSQSWGEGIVAPQLYDAVFWEEKNIGNNKLCSFRKEEKHNTV
ncbi:MAG: bifunctional diaminohydroxyphosphoribosylaminopyrimidine deaminase/5-amino-6-(5-phosphoribosylamino)uracil reductase RibD [Chitinophagales bacterium]